MEKIRLKDKPEDFAKLGLDPNSVQDWEDGRRDTSEANHNEVWYYDANFEDGSKVIVAFRTKTLEKMAVEGDTPNLNIYITMPDGKEYQELLEYPSAESHFGTEHCDVKMGPHFARGDFKSWDLHYEPVNGYGVHLHYDALVDPFRQGTAEIAIGDDEAGYYSDLSVPRSRVTGTLTFDGKLSEVEGSGYHDHQWMNISALVAWHHWLWGRMYTDKYTVYIYDFVSSGRYGFTRVPLFGVQDKAGKVVFMTNGTDMTLEASTFHEDVTDKDYPKTSRYVFEHDGNKVEFTVTWEEQLEIRDVYGSSPEPAKARFDAMGIRPSYLRFFAKGDVKVTIGDVTEESSGNMIYEYFYAGVPDERAGVEGCDLRA